MEGMLQAVRDMTSDTKQHTSPSQQQRQQQQPKRAAGAAACVTSSGGSGSYRSGSSGGSNAAAAITAAADVAGVELLLARLCEQQLDQQQQHDQPPRQQLQQQQKQRHRPPERLSKASGDPQSAAAAAATAAAVDGSLGRLLAGEEEANRARKDFVQVRKGGGVAVQHCFKRQYTSVHWHHPSVVCAWEAYTGAGPCPHMGAGRRVAACIMACQNPSLPDVLLGTEGRLRWRD
jgi:hypothetical protein